MAGSVGVAVPRYSCQEKQEARNDTIKSFRSSLIGTPLQYWTLAGPCGKAGKVRAGSELGWALREGLVEPHQFHGVDCNHAVTARNRSLPGNWYCGDFFETLRDYEKLQPGFINYDSMLMPAKGAEYLARVLYLVRDFRDLVVVGNFVIRTRYYCAERSDVFNHLQHEPLYQAAWRTGHWTMPTADRAYEYPGSGGGGKTVMLSIVLRSE